jgi:hypothetical protein
MVKEAKEAKALAESAEGTRKVKASAEARWKSTAMVKEVRALVASEEVRASETRMDLDTSLNECEVPEVVMEGWTPVVALRGTPVGRDASHDKQG